MRTSIQGHHPAPIRAGWAVIALALAGACRSAQAPGEASHGEHPGLAPDGSAEKGLADGVLSGAEDYLLVARISLRGLDADGAIETLSLGLESHPESVRLLAQRAALYETLHYLRAAEGDYERAVALDPGRGELWQALGRVRLELDLPTLALAALERAESLGGSQDELSLLLARTKRRMGRHADAARDYDRHLGSVPDAPTEVLIEAASLFGLHPASASQEDLQRSLELAAEACRREPEESRAWFVRGLLEETLGRPDEACVAYRAAVEENPDFREAWTNLAVAALAAGNSSLALGALERALELEPQASRRAALRNQFLLRVSSAEE